MALKSELGRIDLIRVGFHHRGKLEKNDVLGARTAVRSYFQSRQYQVTVAAEGTTLVVYGCSRRPGPADWEGIAAVLAKDGYQARIRHGA
ncbi:MAG: hypothetical protein HY520_00550 [Candidatus Aenigmarchaeota archaeon]|nr:hypothetical protein [Candidatus Aenigmarchaeota archaeon]